MNISLAESRWFHRPSAPSKIFKHVISLARTREEWSHAIQNALSAGENTPEQSVRRQRVARDYDWDGLVAKIVRAITDGLGMNVPPSFVVPT